jgi:oxalyl-CoA decarboxylase
VNAAAAHGFVAGYPAVALTVSAPGFLNALPALLEAKTNGFPLICIGGSSTRATVDLDQGEYEGLDQLAYARPFVKKSLRINNISDIPLAVARAMHVALGGRPGPVYIDLPDDAVAQTLDAQIAAAQLWTPTCPAPQVWPSQKSVNSALQLLAKAQRPLMIIGKGAAWARAEDALCAFANKTNIPFLPMSMAKGLIPDTHPNSAAACRSFALKNADCVLLVGARLNWMLSFGRGHSWAPDVQFIQLEIDPHEIENARPIACPVVGSLDAALQMMTAGLDKTPVQVPQPWLDALHAHAAQNVQKFAARKNSTQVPMGHFGALGAIKRVYDKHPDVILTNEGANALDACRNIIDIYAPRHRLDCGTWGVMGCAVSYAIGAAVASGGPVLYVGGDSGFGFDAMEIEVACRYNLPITFVVLNNGGIYRGDFKNLAALAPGPKGGGSGGEGVTGATSAPAGCCAPESSASDTFANQTCAAISADPSPLTLTYDAHYERMIEAFGGTGYYASTPDKVEQAVEASLAGGRPSLVHVQLAQYAGAESGNIGSLNPKPAVGALATSEETLFDYKMGAHM